MPVGLLLQVLGTSLVACALLTAGAFVALRRQYQQPSSVNVVVLGDIARSPRTCNHARSLLEKGWTVQLLGYTESTIPEDLTSNPKLTIRSLKPPFGPLSAYPRFLYLPLAITKFLGLALSLVLVLLFPSPGMPLSRYILVQNPPSLPTLPVVRFVVLLTRQKLIIDWHNTGSSILALRFGPSSPIVRLHQRLESFAGQSAFAHLFVTDAMRTKLSEEMQLKGTLVTFHDRPPRHFRHLALDERKELFKTLADISPPQGWKLAVSSTSWTADEDFGVLLDALSALEKRTRDNAEKEGCLVVITGKGPLKSQFQRNLAQRRKEEDWRSVDVRLAWLQHEQYPLLLGSADFGISLHQSSSGFDLPMKVVDMFGCGLPVVSLKFHAISELVQDGVNGFAVSSAEELANRMQRMLDEPHLLNSLRQGIQTAGYGDRKRPWIAWQKEWDSTVWPVLNNGTT